MQYKRLPRICHFFHERADTYSHYFAEIFNFLGRNGHLQLQNIYLIFI